MRTILKTALLVGASLCLLFLLSCSPFLPTSQAVTAVCTGTVPENARLCATDDQNLRANTPLALVYTCTGNRQCEYTCLLGYRKVGSLCLPAEGKCLGGRPANTEPCSPRNEVDLTENLYRTAVESCTGAKCEYTCKDGFQKSGNACRRVTGG